MAKTGYTADEIRKLENGDVGMFQMLWKPTCQVRLPAPVEGLRGKLRDTVIFSYRNGKCVMRPYVVPRDTKTASQLRKRAHMARASAAWQALTPAQREQWKRWARRYRQTDDAERKPHGQAVFAGAVVTTGMMALPSPTTAPSGPPPEAIISIEQSDTAISPATPKQSDTGFQPVTSDDTFSFRIRHNIRNLKGKRLLIELTNAMPTARRKPRDQDFRLWSEDDAASFVELRHDGEIYHLERARFAIAPGARYAVRVTVVTDQGIRSRPVRVEFVRQTNTQNQTAAATRTYQRALTPQPRPTPARRRTNPITLLRTLRLIARDRTRRPKKETEPSSG